MYNKFAFFCFMPHCHSCILKTTFIHSFYSVSPFTCSTFRICSRRKLKEQSVMIQPNRSLHFLWFCFSFLTNPHRKAFIEKGEKPSPVFEIRSAWCTTQGKMTLRTERVEDLETKELKPCDPTCEFCIYMAALAFTSHKSLFFSLFALSGFNTSLAENSVRALG